MTRRAMVFVITAVVAFGLTALADGTLSGYTSLEAKVNLSGPTPMNSLDLDIGVTYSIGDVLFGSDTLIVLPGLWVWQGFSAGAAVGAFSVETNVLFSGYLAEHLFTEAIIGLSIGGIDFAFHAAQLGNTVMGGAAAGWAVRVGGTAGPIDIVSVTEFGARIEDDEYSGITIVHASTGRSRHYATDPRILGDAFTGEKITIGLPFCCADVDAAVYFSCANGFEYARLGVTGIGIENLGWLELSASVKYEVDEKTFELTPELDLGEVLCFTLYSALVFTGGEMTPLAIDGIKFQGLELASEFGRVTFRDATIFDSCNLCITTEEYGSVVMAIDDALDQGIDYYPDYWEMFSIGYAGPGCCEGEYTFVVNAYFERDGANLFDLAMIYAEANIPIGELFSLSLGLKTTFPNVDWLKFGFEVVF